MRFDGGRCRQIPTLNALGSVTYEVTIKGSVIYVVWISCLLASGRFDVEVLASQVLLLAVCKEGLHAPSWKTGGQHFA